MKTIKNVLQLNYPSCSGVSDLNFALRQLNSYFPKGAEML